MVHHQTVTYQTESPTYRQGKSSDFQVPKNPPVTLSQEYLLFQTGGWAFHFAGKRSLGFTSRPSHIWKGRRLGPSVNRYVIIIVWTKAQERLKESEHVASTLGTDNISWTTKVPPRKTSTRVMIAQCWSKAASAFPLPPGNNKPRFLRRRLEQSWRKKAAAGTKLLLDINHNFTNGGSS